MLGKAITIDKKFIKRMKARSVIVIVAIIICVVWMCIGCYTVMNRMLYCGFYAVFNYYLFVVNVTNRTKKPIVR